MKLFGASWCNPCRQAKKWLLDHNIAYEYIDVEENTVEAEKLGITSIPAILVGDEVITGFSPDEYKQKLL